MSVEISKTEKSNKKWLKEKIKQNIQEMWDSYKRSNIYIMGIPEAEVIEKKNGKTFETIMTGNFPLLMSDISPQILEENNKQEKKKGEGLTSNLLKKGYL